MLIATMICCALSLSWAEESDAEVIDSGTCGPNLTWQFGDMGNLTIDGTGDMDFSGGEPPWKDYMEWITTVTIRGGVSSIEDNAFEGCTSLFEVINLSTLDIQKGKTDNGYVAYYAKNVFTSEDDATVSVMDEVYIFGSYEEDIYMIKFFSYSDTVYLPENVNYGEYVICKDFFTSDKLSVLTVPSGIISVEEGAFGDVKFYDEDGVTELEANADNLRGSTFASGENGLVKQPYADPSTNTREMSPVVAYIAGLLSVGLIVYVIRRN